MKTETELKYSNVALTATATDNHQCTLVKQMLLLLHKNHTIAKTISSNYLLQTYG